MDYFPFVEWWWRRASALTPDIGRLIQHKKCTTEVESVKVLSWSRGGGGLIESTFFTFAGIKISAEMREGGGGRESKFTS